MKKHLQIILGFVFVFAGIGACLALAVADNPIVGGVALIGGIIIGYIIVATA